MKTKSIRFRLTAWYAGLLAVLLILFGGSIYFTLERFLERNLSDTLAKEAQTIGESWLRDVNQTGPGYVAGEIEEHFAPSITGRFVRITRSDGSDVYHSGAPESGAFDPKQIGPKRFDASQSLREEHLSDHKELLIFMQQMLLVVMTHYEVEVSGLQQKILDAGHHHGTVAFADLRNENADRQRLLLAK